MSDLIKGLRGELLNCECCAYGWHECACDTVWPECLTREAADRIEQLQSDLLDVAGRNIEFKAVMQMALTMLELCNKNGWMLADYEQQMYDAIAALKEALR